MESNLETTIKLENNEVLPIIETVRAALFYRGKFLILQKTIDSKNPGGLEFPGGKIDNIKNIKSTIEEQEEAVREEIRQETGINISNLLMEKVQDFGTYFETQDKDGNKKKNKRQVHLFLVRIPDSYEFSIKVNQTRNEKGESEDKHQDYVWVSPDELINSAINLKENSKIGKATYPLTRNSRPIKELLKKAGILQDKDN